MLKILFAAVAFTFLFLPVHVLIKAVIAVLNIFAPMLELIAAKKGMPLTLLHFLWSDFFGPLFRFLVLVIGFIALVPAEIIAVWGFPIYFALIPVSVLVLKRWFTSFCEKLPLEEILES